MKFAASSMTCLFLPCNALASRNLCLSEAKFIACYSLSCFSERGVNEDAGIEGILSRLEKQRNTDFGINLGRIEHEILPARKDNGYYRFDTPKDVGKSVHAGSIMLSI